jgi:hypothetical protein
MAPYRSFVTGESCPPTLQPKIAIDGIVPHNGRSVPHRKWSPPRESPSGFRWNPPGKGMVGRATVDSSPLSRRCPPLGDALRSPDVAEFPPPGSTWRVGSHPWLPRGLQSLDHPEKPPTYVEVERCLGGPVLRACGHSEIADGSAEVVLLRGRGVVCDDWGIQRAFPTDRDVRSGWIATLLLVVRTMMAFRAASWTSWSATLASLSSTSWSAIYGVDMPRERS